MDCMFFLVQKEVTGEVLTCVQSVRMSLANGITKWSLEEEQNMTNAEKFEQVFGVKPDTECCPLECDENDGGMRCCRCEKRQWFKENYNGND